MHGAMNLIVPVPAGLSRILADLHARHWPAGDRYNPHLTVKMPFYATVPFDALVARVEEAIAGFGPFHVMMRGVEASKSKTPWIHVVVRNPDVLRAMHNAAYGALQDITIDETPYLRWFEGSRYTPHISLGPTRDLADPAAVLAALQEEQIVCRFRVRTLRLDGRDEEGRWDAVRTFLLAGSAHEGEEATAPPAN